VPPRMELDLAGRSGAWIGGGRARDRDGTASDGNSAKGRLSTTASEQQWGGLGGLRGNMVSGGGGPFAGVGPAGKTRLAMAGRRFVGRPPPTTCSATTSRHPGWRVHQGGPFAGLTMVVVRRAWVRDPLRRKGRGVRGPPVNNI